MTEFVQTLRDLLRREDPCFQEWFDPKIRTGSDFNLAIREAVSGSTVFLCVLSPAYDDSPYCKKEIAEFRACPQPAFGLKVGTLSRIQGILLEDLGKERWPPELRSTSPHHFFDTEVARFNKPKQPEENHPYVKGLWKTRDSILDTVREMRLQKTQGTAVDKPYRTETIDCCVAPTVYLADVSDDLFNKRENLREALKQVMGCGVKSLNELSSALGVGIFQFICLGGILVPPHRQRSFTLRASSLIRHSPPIPPGALSSGSHVNCGPKKRKRILTENS